jgi:hypothetical protein
MEVPCPVAGHQLVNTKAEVDERPIVWVLSQDAGPAAVPERVSKYLERRRLILDDDVYVIPDQLVLQRGNID